MKFFTKYLTTTSIIPLIDNENDFQLMRRNSLDKYTITEYQIRSRIAKSLDLQTNNNVNNTLLKRRNDKNSKWINKLIIHYAHESRLKSSNAVKSLVRRNPNRGFLPKKKIKPTLTKTTTTKY